jgi:hypothetical protein
MLRAKKKQSIKNGKKKASKERKTGAAAALSVHSFKAAAAPGPGQWLAPPSARQ